MVSMDLFSEQPRSNRPEEPAVELAPNTVLYREGEPGLQVFLVEEGELELLRRGPEREIPLFEVGAGDLLGTEALTDLGRRTATARARTSARLIALDPPLLEEVIRSRPEIAGALLARLARRVRQLEEAAVPPPVPALRARLVHAESNATFTLKDQFANSIGRHDGSTGFAPTLDLAPLDEQRSISRLHARIVWWQGQLLLAEEERATNGSFVNGERLPPGAVRRLAHGDELRFGLVRLRLEKD